jgi:hypothetical protein
VTETARPPEGSGLSWTLEILGLWALAGAQPLLDLFGNNPEFFVAGDAGRNEILTFGLVVALAVPAVLIAVEAVIRWIHRGAGEIAHLVVLGLLALLLGLNVAAQLGLEATLAALAVAGAITAGLLVARQRLAPVRLVLRYLAIALAGFLALFCFASDSGRLAWAQEAEVAEGVQVGEPGPVAVLVFDELPLASLMRSDGTINEARFPNFGRLAEAGTWYRNATSVSPSTTFSVPSILSGRLPEFDDLPTSSDFPVNLFTVLGGSHEIDGFESATDLCPDRVCQTPEDDEGLVTYLRRSLSDATVVFGHLTLPEGLSDGLPAIDEQWSGFLREPEVDPDPEPRGDAPADFLRGLAAEAQERGGQSQDLIRLIADYEPADHTVLVGHDAFLPHRPWHLTPRGNAYDPPPAVFEDGRWFEDPVAVRRAFQRHLLQVGYADAVLGVLIERLEAAGLWEEATVVVVADHGISFRPGGSARSPTEQNLQEIYRVPLIIKAPGQVRGRVSDENALTTDVFPTVLDLLGVDPPADADFDGRSLVAGGDGPERKPVVFERGPEAVPGGWEAILPAVVRNHAWLGEGDGWRSVFRVGAWGPLVGRSVETLRLGDDLPAEWRVNQRDELRSIEAGATVLPVAVTGVIDLSEGVDLPSQVLVALDGTIVTAADIDDRDFSGLADERLLTPGEHRIDLYVPVGDFRLRHLVPE